MTKASLFTAQLCDKFVLGKIKHRYVIYTVKYVVVLTPSGYLNIQIRRCWVLSRKVGISFLAMDTVIFHSKKQITQRILSSIKYVGVAIVMT